MKKQKTVMDNLYIILVLTAFVMIVIFYPNKADLICNKSQDTCVYSRVTFVNKTYTKKAKLSSLSQPMYSSYYARFRDDDVMYLVDNDKDSDNNVFVQLSFRTLYDAKKAGREFNQYLTSDENEFTYTDRQQPKTYRNVLLFCAFVFLLSLGNLYFDFR